MIHGDVFQDAASWGKALLAALAGRLSKLAGTGRQRLFVANGPLPDGLGPGHVPILPLELHDQRAFAALRGKGDLSDLVLLWTSGHPAAAELVCAYANGGAFFDVEAEFD